uniref:Uncharacterized protein n=1 Tax=Romanomermis culicivorax TaxID=13658 RepID=A0A915L557_ROMCU
MIQLDCTKKPPQTSRVEIFMCFRMELYRTV